MQRDGRSFDHGTLEALRPMAVERVREGGSVSSVISSCGFSRSVNHKWPTRASSPRQGLNALRSWPSNRRTVTLTPRQERQVFGWVNGKDPRRCGLGFGLWTQAMIASLIEMIGTWKGEMRFRSKIPGIECYRILPALNAPPVRQTRGNVLSLGGNLAHWRPWPQRIASGVAPQRAGGRRCSPSSRWGRK